MLSIVETQRNERDETTGLILELTQAQHVIDPMTRLLDVAVQHRGGCLQTLAMGEAMDARPVFPMRVVVNNLVADLLVKDLGAAAGERIETGIDQFVQNLVSGQAADPLEPVDLGGGERLQRHIRAQRRA